MKAKLRKVWTYPLIASITILTAAGIAVAPSASAATASGSAPKTCTAEQAVAGHDHYAIDSYTDRKLAWTAITAASGLPVNLERYKDTLSQCWHFIFGFGHGKFEIQLTGIGLFISENPKTHLSGVPLELEPCLSKSSQLWVNFGRFGSRFELAARPQLCIGSDTKIQSGAVLYQERCSNSSARQHWEINTSP